MRTAKIKIRVGARFDRDHWGAPLDANPIIRGRIPLESAVVRLWRGPARFGYHARVNPRVLHCPRCGAPIDDVEGALTTCKFCGSKVDLGAQALARHYQVPVMPV